MTGHGNAAAAPAISIVMPVFNGASTIGRSIESVLAQTRTDFELLVIDDGSTDDTAAVVAAFEDPRIQLHCFANAGASASRNRGIRLARGALIAFLDADDWWAPEKLADQAAALAGAPDAALAYSFSTCVDDDGNVLHQGSHVVASGSPYALLVTRNFLDSGSNPLVRREALIEAGPFDESLVGGEDWDLWLRIGHRHPFACVPKVQVNYRVHAGSSSSRIDRQAADCFKVLQRALARLPPSALRNRSRRTATANINRYIAVRLVETSRGRADGLLAARYWWRFVRATPTPLAHLGKAILIGGAIVAILLLPPAQLQKLRQRAVRGQQRLHVASERDPA
jgi:glycosyltransferase involved in cell wall biosynthesis